MEELLEQVARAALSAMGWLLRGAFWLFLEFGVHLLGWYCGWPVLRAFSLGRYPVEQLSEYGKASTLTTVCVVLTGFIALLLALCAVASLPGPG